MSDRVAIMDGGVMSRSARRARSTRSPDSLFVADFVGSSNRFPGKVLTAEGGDRYEVELEGVGRGVVEGVPGMAAGDDVLAIVRPESSCPWTGTRGTCSRSPRASPMPPISGLT